MAHTSKSATQADLDRIYGRNGVIFGAPVRPRPPSENPTVDSTKDVGEKPLRHNDDD